MQGSRPASRKKRSVRGQNLIEILVAIIFLALGGMALYTAASRTVSEAAWGAERVLCEGLLNDMVEYAFTLGFSELKNNPTALPGRIVTDETDANKLVAVVDNAASDAIESVPSLNPVGIPPALIGPPLITGTDAIFQAQYKRLCDEWNATKTSIGLKRLVFFRDNKDQTGTITCVVKWKSQAGHPVSVFRQVVLHNAL